MFVLWDKEDFMNKQINDVFLHNRKAEEGYKSSSCVPAMRIWRKTKKLC